MKKTLGILFLCLVPLLVGCTKKGSGGASGSTTSPKIIKEDSYILEIWTAHDGPFLEALGREFVSQLGEAGLSLKVISFDSQSEMHERLVNDLASGGGPDVIYTDGLWIAQNRPKLIPGVNTDSFNVKLYNETFVRAAGALLVIGESIYGVPLGIDTLAVIYNEEHLIDSLKDRYVPGSTWDIFQKDVEILSKPDNSFERFFASGVALGRTDNTQYTFDVFENIYAQMGGTMFSPDGSRAVFASQRGVSADGKRRTFATDALQFITYFADDRHKSYAWSEFMADKNNPQKEYLPFIQGKVSMVFGYARDWQRIQDLIGSNKKLFSQKIISKDNVRVSLLPQFYNPSQSADRAAVARVESLAVTRGSKYPDISWKFLQFAISKDNLRSYFEKTNVPSPRLDLITEQEATPNIGAFVRQAKFAQSYNYPMEYRHIVEEFYRVITLVNEQKTTVAEGLSFLERQFNTELAKDLKKKREIEQIRIKKGQIVLEEKTTP